MRRASVFLWFKSLNKLVSIHNSSLNNGDIEIEIDKITPWIRLLHRSRVTPAWVFILLAVTGGQGIRAVYPPLTSLKNESTSCRWNTPPVLTLSVQVWKLLQEEGLLTARWSCLFVCLLFIYFVHYKPTMQDHIFKFRLKFDLDILTKKSNIRGIPHMQNSRVDQQKTQHSVYTSLIIWI